jgi:hypothetical protein
MNHPYLFPQYTWNWKAFTSQDHLFEASYKGLISVNKQPRNQYGHDYTFSTLEGEKIASFYKDDTLGFSSQAYGIELPKFYYQTSLQPA